MQPRQLGMSGMERDFLTLTSLLFGSVELGSVEQPTQSLASEAVSGLWYCPRYPTLSQRLQIESQR